MQAITNYASLWRELVEVKRENQSKSIETPGDSDYWAVQARKYDQRVKSKWTQTDNTRDLLLKILQPDSSIIDIGAGTGAWTLFFAKFMREVTAIEPSKAMRAILEENIDQADVSNVNIITDKWPAANPQIHDYVFCSHAMYECSDFECFIKKMIACANKMCFLLIRAPSLDGLITEACLNIWKQPHDSPNFTIAYNLLLQMGINANVQFEETTRPHFIVSDSEDAAFHEIKERMGLLATNEHDAYLRGLLKKRLILQNGQYIWPGISHSALIFWKVTK